MIGEQRTENSTREQDAVVCSMKGFNIHAMMYYGIVYLYIGTTSQ